jgi:hypothetical protein
MQISLRVTTSCVTRNMLPPSYWSKHSDSDSKSNMYVRMMGLQADTDPRTHRLLNIRANYSTDTFSESVRTFLEVRLRHSFLEVNQPGNVFLISTEITCSLRPDNIHLYKSPPNGGGVHLVHNTWCIHNAWLRVPSYMQARRGFTVNPTTVKNLATFVLVGNIFPLALQD